MPLILLLVALCALRYFEVWRFAELSWWWIVALAGFAFVWFEFIEKIFGLDKKKAFDVDEKRRQDRLNKTFEKKK